MRFVPALALALFAPALGAQEAPQLVVEEGAALALPGGGTGTVLSLGLPSTTDEGEVAFTGSLLVGADTLAFVYFDDGLRWVESSAPGGTVLHGREPWAGAGNAGEFVYSPTINGVDGLWTDLGLLVRRGDPAPGASGQFVSFASRPGMTPGGAAYWMGGVAATAGGPTASRAFYVSPDRTAASATVAVAEGQTVGGAAITALDFSYGISGDGAHRAFIVTRNTGSTASDGAVVLDGALLAQEGTLVGPVGVDQWESFDLVRVDGAGHALIAGNTTVATTMDEVVVYEGGVMLREGQTVAGVTLGTDVRGLAMNDDGLIAWAWTTSTGPNDEAVFVGRVPNLAGTSMLALRTGHGLDTFGDGTPDYTVTDFGFAKGGGHGALVLGDSPVLYLRLGLTPVGGGAERAAIVGLDLTPFVTAAESPTEASAPVALAVAPNPAREGAAITLTLDAARAVTVEVLDVLGRRVALLHDGPLAAGRHALTLGAVAPGVYVVRVTGEGVRATHPLTVAR